MARDGAEGRKDKETAGKEDAATTTERTGSSAAQKETESDIWESVVELVQFAFREGKLAEEGTWQVVVLIPKGKKYYRGIGLWR